ncbi:MAG: hypothetical protein ACYS6W_02440 [Planctomycetota bacterium]|jgi:outer membrane lipoprotein-sorting protein
MKTPLDNDLDKVYESFNQEHGHLRETLMAWLPDRSGRKRQIGRFNLVRLFIGGTIMKSRITKIAAAAVIIIAVIVGINQFSIDGASIVFADVLEQINNFRPYTGTITVQEEGTPTVSKRVMMLSLTQRREIHSNGTIVVFDLARAKTLTLVPEKKYAIERILDVQATTDFDLLRLVSAMQNAASLEIGTRELEGRIAKGFRSTNKVNDIIVWADIQTKLPIRVEVVHVGKGRIIIMSEFKFDVNFDESLFSVTAPEDYTVERVEKGDFTELQNFVRRTTEEDLVEGLRAVAIFLDGEFPAGIELRELQKALREYIKRNNLPDSEVQDRLKAISEKWTKAHWYIKLLKGDLKVRDFHYAGEGVKLGAANTPIISWWPRDSQTCRVIFGDLSARDVMPEDLQE